MFDCFTPNSWWNCLNLRPKIAAGLSSYFCGVKKQWMTENFGLYQRFPTLSLDFSFFIGGHDEPLGPSAASGWRAQIWRNRTGNLGKIPRSIKKKEVSKIPPKVVDSDFFDFSCTGVPVHGVTIDNYMSVPIAVARKVEDSPAAVPWSRYVGVSWNGGTPKWMV